MTTIFRRPNKVPFAPSLRQIADAINQLIDFTVQKGGPLSLNVKTLTSTDSPYTVTDADQLIKCDTTSGSITINLPAVASYDARQLTIKKTSLDNNIITLDPNSTETIDGALTKVIQGQYAGLTIRADAATGWDLIGFF